ncbi:hypothetical protein BFG51_04570 [Dietzia alimentaria]|nr:hypothetical protein BFG51_04570 [Dietzia alimentaria]
MALEMGLWRAENDTLTRLTPSMVGLEARLEAYVESDPTMLGQHLMVLGRQVRTPHGGFIDLLAIDSEGLVHVIELKRDKTPRDVTAQTLDYASWVATLGRADIVEIFESHRSEKEFEEAFDDEFGDAPPDEINESQVFTIVAATVDPATERIVRFLNEVYGIPINVVFFRHFEDNGVSYIARSWLVEPETQAAALSTARSAKKFKEAWNGRDWYISFGEADAGRSWEDAEKYGFVSAGGGKWFSRTMKNPPVGARVFVCIPKTGYVGVGQVLGEAKRFVDATVQIDEDERRLADLPLAGDYRHPGDDTDDDNAEWVIPVAWERTVPRSQAFWKPGMFANQNSASRLRSQFTIEQVTSAFGLAI